MPSPLRHRWSSQPFSTLAIGICALSRIPFASAISKAEVAAHVIYSYDGTDPPASLVDLAGKCQLGGLIIFTENVDDNLGPYVNSLQDAYSSASCDIAGPLLILTDQEGGEVLRLPGGPTLSEKDIGASSDPQSAASTAGSQAASALAAYSVNGNLAPVLDVYRQEGDFEDQYERSYSSDAGIVSECGARFVTAQQKSGIAATAKHFPGLGAASADENTDEGPVTINLSLDVLQTIDEAPYGPAIDAGIQMVMPSWALYPALDPDYPSGLSSKWLQGELRGRLGFKGVIITDAIEAGGLDAFGQDPGHRSVLATQAGVDIILAAARNATQGDAVVTGLVNALQDGTLDSAEFQTSTARIAKLRGQL